MILPPALLSWFVTDTLIFSYFLFIVDMLLWIQHNTTYFVELYILNEFSDVKIERSFWCEEMVSDYCQWARLLFSFVNTKLE